MPTLYQKYKDPEFGVINAIGDTEQPLTGLLKCDNMYHREGKYRKLPGLTEIHDSQIDSFAVRAIYEFKQITSDDLIILVVCGGKLYKYDEQNRSFDEIYSGLVTDAQVEFLQDGDNLYFGSNKDTWRKYTGGNKTYTVGGANPPLKFKQILYNRYAQRFFGIGVDENPDILYWSEHIDNGGIEVWPPSNQQVIDSEQGDVPQRIETFEGRISIFSDHSVNSGDVRGVPETWSFQREKSKGGTVADRTVKRVGSQFLMLDENAEVYKWPNDQFITKGKVTFSVDRSFVHLATADVVEDRYYVLCFKHGMATSTNKYHWWVYDTLTDRWYGPSLQRNIVSMFYSKHRNILLCGGTDDLKGFVMEYRGRNIKNVAMKCHVISSSSDFEQPNVDKRYSKVWFKGTQEGTLAGQTGQLELIVNVDNKNDDQQSQLIKLVDPDNENLSDTGAVRRAITKRKHIHENVGLGNAIQWEVKHEVLNGDFTFSEIEIEYYLRYLKENRGV